MVGTTYYLGRLLYEVQDDSTARLPLFFVPSLYTVAYMISYEMIKPHDYIILSNLRLPTALYLSEDQ